MASNIRISALFGVFIVAVTAMPHRSTQQVRSSNPCALGSVDLYYPYPGDESRYIQCSQWGRYHIKSCGVGQAWNNDLKTCTIKQTSGSQHPSQNRIYTTGPSGYQVTNDQYQSSQANNYQVNYQNNNNNMQQPYQANNGMQQLYQTNNGLQQPYQTNNGIQQPYQTNNGMQNKYQTNNGQNGYVNQGQPQLYIDANNNVGVMYSNGYQQVQNTRHQVSGIQDDVSREYTGSWSSDVPVGGNSLWTTFSNALQPSQNQPQGNRLYGQSMVGSTNRQQSGRLSGTGSTRSYQSTQGNSLWNRNIGYLMGNSNRVQTSTYNAVPSSTNTQRRASNTAYLVDKNKMNTGHINTQSNSQMYASNTMVHAQKQAPARTQMVVSNTQPVSGFDVPELCRDATIRYISAQNDYHHFYECVKGSAEIKTCPDGKVWVHPLRQCIDLADHNNRVASHNPCIGSDVRFHPYPADPTKYVECQSWYRVYVWRCKDGLWTQNKQQCSTGMHQNPEAKTVTTSQNVHVSHYFQGYCDGKTFYYAHENPAKYVQCDEFGKWFLKDCAMNTTWDDSLKGCVQSFSTPGPAETTVNTVTNSVETMDRVSRQLPDDFDASLQSYPCSANYAWDVTRNECVAISLSDYLPTCRRGYMWDPNRKECIMYVDPSTVAEFPDTEYARPNCMAGHRWDQEQQMCVQDTLGDQVNTNHRNFLFEVDLGATDMSDSNNQQQFISQQGQTGTDLAFLPNICDTPSGRFYYPYPGKPNMFIQCDQLGVMHTQSCGDHSIWNNEIMTCVPGTAAVLPTDSRQYTGSYQGHQDNTKSNNIFGDVCNGPGVFHPYSANKRMFIMCFNSTQYMMSCPQGSYWDESVTTCNWPQEDEK